MEVTKDGPLLFNDLKFDNSYARLPANFYASLNPVPVTNPHLVKFNSALADTLGLEASSLRDDMAAAIFSGNRLLSDAEPVAMAYAGHQFGNFVPQLGDGRAILLGEIIRKDGKRYDIHLKGSGRTPYARRGDGRSPLGPVIREYIISEAMHALGIPTTRSLAVVATGETVLREKPLPGGVLTRIALSHIRVGTFEYFAAKQDRESLKLLADYVIARLYPDVADAENPYLALLTAVIDRQAHLIAAWMKVGFIHGVMNTDNMTVSGETIDYGPCAFMDRYDPVTVFSSIDLHGRYAFANQTSIAQWNLARFAETLLSFLDDDIDRAVKKAEDAIQNFSGQFGKYWLAGMRDKLGLLKPEEGDGELINNLLNLMKENSADFTQTFRSLCDAAEANDFGLQAQVGKGQTVQAWLQSWRTRLRLENKPVTEIAAAMRQVNPVYIPRNHLVEEAIAAAVEDNDFSPWETLLNVLSKPYDRREGYEHYAVPTDQPAFDYRTFCGT